MATFKICVFEHQLRKDGKFPVSIRVYWNKANSYINTEYYVTIKQINKKAYLSETGIKKQLFELKDKHIINELNARISEYEDIKVKKLGNNIYRYSALELAEYLKKEGNPNSDDTINFIEFSRIYCDRLIAKGKKSTAKTLSTPINAMIDFCNGRDVAITEITTRFLRDFETYLRKDRKLERKNQFGRIVKTERSGLSDVSVHDYMTAIRILFNAAIDEYNDEDKEEVRIKHYPFRKYKLEKVPETEKRVLTIDEIRHIRDVSDETLKYPRLILARDVFMLSFYLAGTNLTDLYHAKAPSYTKGRFSYERQKTRGRRQDNAFISLKVQPEAIPLFEKYRDKAGNKVFCFSDLYVDHDNFQANINKGLKGVAAACNISKDLTTYYARFSIATIARNDCKVLKDDINLLLNHIDKSMKITDIYIEKDWSIVDNAIRKVLDHLNQ